MHHTLKRYVSAPLTAVQKQEVCGSFGRPQYRLALRSLFKTQYALWRWEPDTRPGRLLDKSADEALGKHGKTEWLADELQLVYLPLRPPLCTATWCGGHVGAHPMFCTARTMNSINVTTYRAARSSAPSTQHLELRRGILTPPL